MSSEQVNIRLGAELVAALERVAEEESLDRSTMIRRLLETSLRDWKVERAIDAYMRGEVSIGRASEEAEVTQWELIDLARARRVSYPLEVEEVSERIRVLVTLPDIPPKPGGVLLVGINPVPISVRARHYYQGPIGRRLWRRLDGLGLLDDPIPGREDEAFARAGHGLTDLVKRPTASAADLSPEELRAGVEALREKIRRWKPGIVLFAFKAAAAPVLGRHVVPGEGPRIEGARSFVLTGPYAPRAEAARVDAELRALLTTRD